MMPIPQSIPPEIRRGLEAIQSPEVQELIRQLSKHGLAVALPHRHGENGNFLPLPENQVILESDLRISFLQKDDPALKSAIPVMWLWNEQAEVIASCAFCDFYKHP